MSILKSSQLLIVTFIVSFFCSCDYINPAEDIPAYIKVDTVDFNSNSGDNPVNEENNIPHNINGVWLNIDGVNQGSYEMPVTFPVLAEGEHTLTFYNLIKNNGIAAKRVKYPFYTKYSIDTFLTEKEILNITPKFEYVDEAVFAWYEDFEDVGESLKQTARSDTSFIRVRDEVCDGEYSLAVFLDETRDLFEFKSTDSLELPRNGSPVYLELNYKCNNSFTFGLFINELSRSVQYSVITLNPKEEWNKIYIELTYIINQHPALTYSLFFGGKKQKDVENASIYIDNIKLIHF